MWRTLSSRVYGCIAATLTIALVASIIAIAGLRSTAGNLNQILDDNLPSVIAAGEIEIALLEQRGCIVSFILSEGDERWLSELSRLKEEFRECVHRAQQVAYTPQERALLSELEVITDQYDAKRIEVVQLFRSGKKQDATVLAFHEVNDLYRQAYGRCEALNEANQGFMRDSSRQAVRTVSLVSQGVVIAIAVQLVLAGVLMTTFYRGVLKPLRQMAVDLQAYAPTQRRERQQSSDEVESVASYLRLLLSDVADFQSTVENQRKQLFDAQKMASVGRLAANLAHEIRNPLTAMKMWLFSARSSIADRSDVAVTLDSVTQELRRLESIVRQFLEFSRPHDTRRDWVPSSPLIDSSVGLVEPLLREKSIQLDKQLSADVPRLFVDREQMIQVLVNLLRNAAESAPIEGHILVSVDADRDANASPGAVLRVGDNGPGIPAEMHSKVFEPFFTTKEDGTGLGLSIVANIVARHGGRLEVESPSDGGVAMVVHLPLPQEEKSP